MAKDDFDIEIEGLGDADFSQPVEDGFLFNYDRSDIKHILQTRNVNPESIDTIIEMVLGEPKAETMAELFNVIDKIAAPFKMETQRATKKTESEIKRDQFNGLFSQETEIEAEESSEDYFLFYPSKRDMKIEYPELANIPEFRELTNTELLFVWWYGNQSSPYSDSKIDERKRVLLCLREAYGKRLSVEMIDEWMSGNIPDKISLAIKKMRTFIPSIRMQSKLMVEKIFRDYQRIISQDVSKMSVEDRRKHVNLCNSIHTEMPKLISSIEESYGVRKGNSKTDARMRPMDIILSQEIIENEYE